MQFDTQFWVQILIYVAGFAAMWGNVTTRLGYLEQKMDKHNNLQERMAVVEQSAKSAHHRIDDIKEEVIHEKLVEKINVVELAVVIVTGAALIGAVVLGQENLASALGGGLVGYLGAVVPGEE